MQISSMSRTCVSATLVTAACIYWQWFRDRGLMTSNFPKKIISTPDNKPFCFIAIRICKININLLKIDAISQFLFAILGVCLRLMSRRIVGLVTLRVDENKAWPLTRRFKNWASRVPPSSSPFCYTTTPIPTQTRTRLLVIKSHNGFFACSCI